MTAQRLSWLGAALLCAAACPSAWATEPGDAGAAPPGLPPLQALDQVTSRPLFSPDRRPHAAAPVVAKAAAPAIAVTLSGVVLSPQGRLALVEEGSPAGIRRIPEGGQIGAGTVKRISWNSIIIAAVDGSESEVKIDHSKAPPPPASAADSGRTPSVPPPPAAPAAKGAVAPPQPSPVMGSRSMRKPPVELARAASGSTQ